MMIRLITTAFFATHFFVSSAMAAERTFSVTDFESVRVIGPFKVTVDKARATTAKASGTPQSLDLIDLRVQNRVLVVQAKRNTSLNAPPKPAVITITSGNPILSAHIIGAGSLTVNQLKGLKTMLSSQGNSSITANNIDSDVLNVTANGSGQITLLGKAKTLKVTGRGSPGVIASGLTVMDLTLDWRSSGTSSFTATRSAKGSIIGAGDVTVGGPADCTITAMGNGTVVCQSKQ